MGYDGCVKVAVLPDAPRPIVAYGLPVLMVSLVCAIKLFAERWTGTDAPFLFLLGAVTVSAYFADLAGGLLAMALAMITSILLIEPRFELVVADDHDLVQVYSFAGEATVIILLCVALRRSRARAEQSAEETRTLQRQVLESIESQQRRIGQDLHDDLGQFLTAIALSGEFLARRLEKGHSEETEACRALVHMVNEGVNRTRQLARGMSPMTLDPDSLPLLLAELQERSAEIGHQAVTFDLVGNPPDLPHDSVLHLYRIAQEAVSNAMKHSGAKNIDISLICAEKLLTLAVRDNGMGSAKPRKDGMGMRVMAFRARSIGGKLDVGPRQDGPGTAVVCSLET